MMLLKGMAMMAAASSVAAHVRTLHPRAYTPTRASQTERVPLLARVTHWHLTYPIDLALAEHLPQAPGREVSDALWRAPQGGGRDREWRKNDPAGGRILLSLECPSENLLYSLGTCQVCREPR